MTKNLVIVESPAKSKTIEKYLGYIKDKKDMKNVEVAFFGGSFTGLNINDQIGYLKVANEFLISGCISNTFPFALQC